MLLSVAVKVQNHLIKLCINLIMSYSLSPTWLHLFIKKIKSTLGTLCFSSLLVCEPTILARWHVYFFFLFFRNLMYFSRLVQMSSVETLPHVPPRRAKSMAPPSYSPSTLYTPLSHSVYHLVNTKDQVLLIFCDSCLAHSELAILLC